MLAPAQRIVAGISGGADSVCLLFVLLECRRLMNVEFAVVHINHGIRKEAGEDANYVKCLCEEHNIPFYPVVADVQKAAFDSKSSEEEAGRNIRYRAFAEAAADFHATAIAVAHNKNDRAETMLFHLFRGSNIKGLGSIRPVRGNIIRPLLCLERQEIEAYLQERGISYCKDVTNDGDDYTRNRIRHHILPFVEQEIVQQSVRHMSEAADMLAETEDYLEEQTRAALAECMRGEAMLDIPVFTSYHPLLQKRMLYTVITGMTGSAKDITGVHIEKVLELAQKEGNRQISLPYEIVAERSYAVLRLKRQQAQEEKRKDFGNTYYVSYRQGSCEEILGCSAGEYLDRIQEVPQNEYTKCFDYDRIKGELLLRSRRAGDYITIADKDGNMVHKSVKDYMITEKIPREERDMLPLLAEGDHILWITGHRISEYYKIHRNTKRVLQVQLKVSDCEGSETEEKNGGTY